MHATSESIRSSWIDSRDAGSSSAAVGIDSLPAGRVAWTCPDELALLYHDEPGGHEIAGIYYAPAGSALYRDDSIAVLEPRPDFTRIFPLEAGPPYAVVGLAPGMRDPDA